MIEVRGALATSLETTVPRNGGFEMAPAALVGPAEEPVELGPGDYITYSGSESHVFEALEPGTTAVLISEHR